MLAYKTSQLGVALEVPFLFEEESAVYSNYNHVLLDQVALSTGHSISIFNVPENKFLYVSPNSEKWTGLSADTIRGARPTDIMNLVAVEDRPAVDTANYEAFERLYSLPLNEMKRYRFVLDYQLIHSNGTKNRALVHNRPIGFSSAGVPEIFMTITCPIAHLKTDPTVVAIQVMEGKWFEIHYYQKEGSKNLEVGSLTDREAEILEMLSQSLESQEIANRLSLSVHTVATHRRNILHKFRLKDTVAVVSYCRLCGI